MGAYEFDHHEEAILIIDDDPTNLRALQEVLKARYKVYAAPSGEKALAFLEKKIPNLILLDVEMPGMDGYEVIERLKSDYRWEEIPVIFLTAQEGRDKEQLALSKGAVDYILKPIFADVVRSRVGLHIELENYKRNLEKMVALKTEELQRTQDGILEMLSNVTAYRDNETGAHIKRTTDYVTVLTRRIMSCQRPKYFIGEVMAQHIIKSSKLHDLGKVSVPDGILLKPARLTPEEFDIIKQHTTMGAMMLDDVIRDLGKTSEFLNVAREVVVGHHEKWDGSGYPHGRSEHDIPISARIMAIADVYDALISSRPYKAGMSHEEAMEIIIKSSGSHFDPNIVEMCMEAFDLFPGIAEQYSDENFRKHMIQ